MSVPEIAAPLSGFADWSVGCKVCALPTRHASPRTRPPPGGVKLHAELTSLLGAVATAALEGSQAVYTALWPSVGGALVWVLVAAFGLLGLCGGLAAASDLIRVLLLPLQASYLAAAGLYRLHLRCLRAMWRLMRGEAKAEAAAAAAGAVRLRLLRRKGRKEAGGREAAAAAAGAAAAGAGGAEAASLWGNNPRRDGDGEVTAEHVIVGVLLFTPLLALLPTTAAWYLLAALLHWAPAALRRALLGAAVLAARNPACAAARRALRPAAYPGERALGVGRAAGGRLQAVV